MTETVTSTSPSCKECNSTSNFKGGTRTLSDGTKKQRFLCRKCGYRFTPTHEETLKAEVSPVGSNRISADDNTVKNLVDTTTENKNPVVAEKITRTEKEQQEAKGLILQLCVHMTRQNYSVETIRLNRTALKVLFERGANLLDQNSVKDVMAAQKRWSGNRLKNVINAYAMFAKLNNLPWEAPRCNITEAYPWIPTEQEIDCLIAAAPKKLSAFLQLLKETAMRRGEAKRLTWTNVDAERCTITLNEPEKRSNARMWKVSRRLINQLNALPQTHERVFGNSKMDSLKSAFLHLRKRQANKLQNPRLLKIGFHTLRHWKATTLYHETKDILYVRDFLGHKSIKNTEKYVKMERIMFSEYSGDEWTVKIARTEQEIATYLEAGFEYVCQKETLIFLRKRKCSSSQELSGESRGQPGSMENRAEVAQPGRALG